MRICCKNKPAQEYYQKKKKMEAMKILIWKKQSQLVEKYLSEILKKEENMLITHSSIAQDTDTFLY